MQQNPRKFFCKLDVLYTHTHTMLLKRHLQRLGRVLIHRFLFYITDLFYISLSYSGNKMRHDGLLRVCFCMRALCLMHMCDILYDMGLDIIGCRSSMREAQYYYCKFNSVSFCTSWSIHFTVYSTILQKQSRLIPIYLFLKGYIVRCKCSICIYSFLHTVRFDAVCI